MPEVGHVPARHVGLHDRDVPRQDLRLVGRAARVEDVALLLVVLAEHLRAHHREDEDDDREHERQVTQRAQTPEDDRDELQSCNRLD